ncbi:MAG TPA: hypothetical protein DEP36_15850 [Gammaproteobacteria bacterium]|nr:hypothetical protein [Gammaproteobacteria bacterium]
MPAHSSFQFHAIPAGLLPEASRYLIQAAAWFQGWLYLGVTSYPADLTHPGNTVLLRHRLRESGWERLHASTVESRWFMHQGQSRYFPLELGWRALAVLPSTKQPAPALYALRFSLRAPALLYSEEGAHFTEIASSPDTDGSPFINLRSFSGQIFAISARAAHTGRNGPLIWVSTGPCAQSWHPACTPGFGNPENRTIDGLHVFNGQLYAVAGNPTNGFQLWKTMARGQPPFTWEPVLAEGAQRYTLNPHVEALTVFKDMLYLGTRSPHPDPRWEFATSGAEVIRVLANGHWELVTGTPRFSPVGLQIPLSAQGPGFSGHRNRRVSRLMGTPNALYAALDHYEDPVNANPTSEPVNFQLWKSQDGEEWEVVTSDSFGQPAATRLRVLQPTPHGLAVTGDWDLTRDPKAQPGIWLERSHLE